MKADIRHIGKSAFEATIRDHRFIMDTQVAAGGENKGPSPKELLLASVIGCTGMDVAAIMKKHQMRLEDLVIQGEAEPRKEHPKIFTDIHVKFKARGSEITPEVLIDAVHQSLSKFCGVSAMVYKVSPIHYTVYLNESEVGRGIADFGI